MATIGINRIFTSAIKNLVFETGPSAEAIELSCNKVQVHNNLNILGNLEVSGSITNPEIQNMSINLTNIQSQINLTGISLEPLNSDFVSFTDLSNAILNLNFDTSYASLVSFIDLSASHEVIKDELATTKTELVTVKSALNSLLVLQGLPTI